MTEKSNVLNAVRWIAWGYVLIHINLNLGSVNILPNWLGYCLILQALPVLGEEEPSALLLRPLGILLALWEGAVWLLTILEINLGGFLIDAIAVSISLYFHFQLLTNLADFAEKNGLPTKSLLILRTVQTVLITMLAFPIPWEQSGSLIAVMVIVGIVIAIWICCILFSFAEETKEL